MSTNVIIDGSDLHIGCGLGWSCWDQQRSSLEKGSRFVGSPPYFLSPMALVMLKMTSSYWKTPPFLHVRGRTFGTPQIGTWIWVGTNPVSTLREQCLCAHKTRRTCRTSEDLDSSAKLFSEGFWRHVMWFSAALLHLHSWSARVVQPLVSPIFEMGDVGTQAARAELQLGFCPTR